MKFPDGFTWGAATAALQIEGAAGRGDSVWDVFCRRHPERIHQQATPELACDHFHRWRDDVEHIAALGHKGYRMSVSWPRLFPDGRPNQQGFDFYHRLFDALLERQIEPNVTLYHWDLPAYLESWERPETVERYLEFARAAFAAYGDRVKLWSTFNEPGWTILNGYVTGLHPPCTQDFRAAVEVSLRMLEAHAGAVQAFRAEVPDGSVGLVLNMSAVHPAGPGAADRRAARLADGVLNRWFAEPALLGRFPRDVLHLYRDLLPSWFDPARHRDPVDWLGVNYYYPHYASADAQDTDFHLNTSGRADEACRFSIRGLFRFVRNPQGRYTEWNWEIDPQGLYLLLKRAHDYRPGLPVYVTENGIGLSDPSLDDEPRIEFVRQHLEAVHRALAEGVNVRGYYMWSLMDNFSWINGYKKRYGFLRVERASLERTPRKSAAWFREVARANALPSPGPG